MSTRNSKIRFGEFVLNRTKFQLTRGDAVVSLTPKALDLLCTLIDNRDRVMGKDELIDSVWKDAFVEQGNLPYTIRLIRKALGDDAGTPRYIESVPKRGYRFVAKCVETMDVSSDRPLTFPPQKQKLERRSNKTKC